jgi:hypothetical protein
MPVRSKPSELTLQVRVKILYALSGVLWIFTLLRCGNPLYRKQLIQFFRGLPKTTSWKLKCTTDSKGATS